MHKYLPRSKQITGFSAKLAPFDGWSVAAATKHFSEIIGIIIKKDENKERKGSN